MSAQVQAIPTFFDAAKAGDYYYFSSLRNNALFRWKEGTPTEFLCDFEGEYSWQRDMHRRVIYSGDKLFFIPYVGRYIFIYDIINNSMHRILVAKDEEPFTGFSDAYKIDDNIILIPIWHRNPILILSIKSYVLSESLQISKCFPEDERGYDKTDAYSTDICGCELVDDSLYVCMHGTNIIIKLKIDRSGDRLAIYYSSTLSVSEDIQAMSITFFDKKFWITLDHRNSLYVWDCYTKQGEYIDFPDNKKKQWPFLKAIPYATHKMLLISAHDDRQYIVDSSDFSFIDISDRVPDEFHRLYRKYTMFSGWKNSDESIFLLPREENGILRFSKASENFDFIPIVSDSSSVEAFYSSQEKEKQFAVSEIKRMGRKKELLYEADDSQFTLEALIPAVSDYD